MNAETLKTLINAVLTIMGILLTVYVIPWLKQQIGDDRFARLEDYTEYAVRCAEQIYKTDQGKEKKQYVYNYVLTKSSELGLDLEPPDIDLLVEGLVNLVKHGGD